MKRTSPFLVSSLSLSSSLVKSKSGILRDKLLMKVNHDMIKKEEKRRKEIHFISRVKKKKYGLQKKKTKKNQTKKYDQNFFSLLLLLLLLFTLLNDCIDPWSILSR